MLSWLSGGPGDGQEPGRDDIPSETNPDTPAHLFAVRAFGYRLWGTPKAPDTAIKVRQRSASLARAPRDATAADDALLSPSKRNGILLTPGTAAAKRSKTVTFGADEKDADALSRRKATGSVTVPGKFPTPSKLDLTALEDVEYNPVVSSFTERLRNARIMDETRAKEAATKAAPVMADAPTSTAVTTASADTTDWKQVYESYTARTEREMRKLIAKQQAAKHYAREKDSFAAELAEQLKHESKRALGLEVQVKELQRQLRQLKADMNDRVVTAYKPTTTITDEKSLEQRFHAIRQPSPVRPKPAAPAPARLQKPKRPDLDKSDIWADALHTPTTPARQSIPPANPAPPRDDNPLQARDANTLESHTPKQTPPAIRADAHRTPVRRTAAARERSPAPPSPGKRLSSAAAGARGKENAEGAAVLRGCKAAGRDIDSERRAKALARIAARRRERAAGGGGAAGRRG